VTKHLMSNLDLMGNSELAKKFMSERILKFNRARSAQSKFLYDAG